MAVKTKAFATKEAAAELARLLPAAGLAMVLVFVSPCYDPQTFAAEMAAHFMGTPVFGCTTAGEIAHDGWDENSIVAIAFSAADFQVTAYPIFGLSDFHIEDRRSIGESLRQQLLGQDGNGDDEGCFGLVLIDGLCQREDVVLSAIHGSLGHIPMVGGSAADGLRFERSWVFFDGHAHADAAVLLLIRTSLAFRTFSCNNCEADVAKTVVTEADPDRRIVRELNAELAAAEYSRMVGIAGGELDQAVFASHPVLVRVGGTYHARSIHRIDADGALHFGCAIEEGLVLTAGTPRDPVDPTRELFAQIQAEIGEVSLYIGFEGIQRRIGAEQRQCDRDMSDLYRDHRVFGCNTYGELYGAVHVNRTLTGVAFGAPARLPSHSIQRRRPATSNL